MKLLVLCFILIALMCNAQSTLIQKVEKDPSKLSIPYEKYKLKNGLTVIIHEDHSDPIVHVDVTYHVGSNREQIGRSGFAHFFEHMMFQGSDHVADEEHMRVINEAGGTLNGSTNSDRTNYFETVPANQLEVMLWLEADRMGFLLDAVTQKKFEVQRATVKNERGQNYDNKPYGLVNEKVSQALFPYGHPYSWPTIGYIEDLNRVDVNDLKKFFLRWYGPNNAVLTIAGDVKASEALKLAEKYFGTIPPGPDVKPMAKDLVTIDKDRYISYEDNIKNPLLQLNFPAVPNRHPDEAALDILSDLFGGSKNSLIYKNLVKSQKALSAFASNPSRELSGIFTIRALASPGTTLSEIETIIRNSINEFEEKGFNEEDLKRYKANYETQLIESMGSVSGKASMLAAYETFTGNPDYIQQELDNYTRVTKEDIWRVFNKYIKNKPAVIISVVPKGKPELVAKSDNYQPPVINPNDANTKEYDGLVYQKPKDDFERSKKPAPGNPVVVKVPEFWRKELKNGIKIIGASNIEIPMTTIQVAIKGGHRADNKDNAGITYLLTSLMAESTERYSAEQIESELAKLGSSVSIEPSAEEITVTIRSLTKNLSATLKLAEEIMFHPKFDKEEFDLVKNQQLQTITYQNNQPVALANNAFSKMLYGEENILSVPAIGTTQTVEKITLDDVKRHYSTYFAPDFTIVSVVGDSKKADLEKGLRFLEGWSKKGISINTDLPYPEYKTTIYFLNKDKAPQSEIRVGYMAMPYDATGDFYRATIMNFALGGNFNSRINLNLREDKGWTYGARTYFAGTNYPGPFVATAGVRGDATDSSVVEFMKEIRSYAEKGITDTELGYTKSAVSQSEALKYETQVQKAAFLKKIINYNLSDDFTKKQNKILQDITKQEMDQLSRKFLPYERMVIVVVGDGSHKEKLKKLGYPVEELTKEN